MLLFSPAIKWVISRCHSSTTYSRRHSLLPAILLPAFKRIILCAISAQVSSVRHLSCQVCTLYCDTNLRCKLQLLQLVTFKMSAWCLHYTAAHLHHRGFRLWREHHQFYLVANCSRACQLYLDIKIDRDDNFILTQASNSWLVQYHFLRYYCMIFLQIITYALQD